MQDYILELPAFNPTRKFFNQFWTIKQPNFSWFTCFSLVILGVLGKYIWVNHWIFCKIWGGMPKLCWIFFLWWLPSASAIASTKHVRACAVTYLVSMTFWKSDATTYFFWIVMWWKPAWFFFFNLQSNRILIWHGLLYKCYSVTLISWGRRKHMLSASASWNYSSAVPT